jgi:hypothetical protein
VFTFRPIGSILISRPEWIHSRTHLAAGKRGLAILGPPLSVRAGQQPPATLGQGKSDPREPLPLRDRTLATQSQAHRQTWLHFALPSGSWPRGRVTTWRQREFQEAEPPAPFCAKSSRQNAYFVAIAGYSSRPPTRSTQIGQPSVFRQTDPSLQIDTHTRMRVPSNAG